MKIAHWFFPRGIIRRPALMLAAAFWPLAGFSANFYQGVATNALPWPGGIVPYVFATNVTTNEQAVYLAGMREWELAANVRFVARTTQSTYVLLQFDYTQGTNTYVASVPPVMTVDTLSRAQVAHETGHLLGFQHEHVRTNRDSFITVNFNNLIGGNGGGGTNGSGEGGSVMSLYEIDTNSTSFGAYDFESVMHYSRTLFSMEPTTLDVLVPNAPYYPEYYYRIGNYALSPGDRAGAAYLYGLPVTPITNIVTTTADVGAGSLRAAIYYANDHPGTTIKFDIPNTDPNFSGGVYTIYTSGELPPLVANGTVIDATTQPGYAGHPIVAINGSQLIPQLTYPNVFFITGLRVFAANCTISGLAINDFPENGMYVEYAFATSNRVAGCYIGVAPDGVSAAGNGYQGISIDTGASHTFVGGTNAGQGNVIGGNGQYGILIIGTNGQNGATLIGTNVNNNVVQGNIIGLNAAGSAAITHPFSGIGIWGGSSSNLIGGAVTGARNVISGNNEYGVYVSDSNTVGTVFQGNYIGTDSTGSVAISNGVGGIGIFNGANHVTVGGTAAGARNVLSGNSEAGLWLKGPGVTNNVVQGNYIGVNAAGTGTVANTAAGIYVVDGSSSNLIGGTVAGAANLISGNSQFGLYISDQGTTSNLVQGNFIGMASDGMTALPNTQIGVYVLSGAQSNTIGGVVAGAGNLISGNGSYGIQFFGAGNSFNLVQGNYIGVAGNGTSALPNLGPGIYFEEVSSNTIGGTVAGAQNIISANANDGVQFYNSSYNIVQGNFVGMDKTGLHALGNKGSAVSIFAASAFNTIGGTSVAARNILSAGTNGDGVYISDTGTSNNVVQGNFIGTDITGDNAFGNGANGVVINTGAENNLIGGTAAGAGNLVSANYGDGIQIVGDGATFNVVQGNLVGTTANGSSRLGNGGSAMNVSGGPQFNTIGGVTAAARNVFSGCTNYDGVFISAASNNVVEGNYIGTDATGLHALANGAFGYGLTLFGGCVGNQIGGSTPGAGNVIAASVNRGVFISDPGTTGNLVQGNYIGVGSDGITALGNGAQGIEIGNSASDNTIGFGLNGLGAANVIAHNTDEGIILYDTATIGNTIRGNSIFSNGALGINLVGGSESGLGVTANHSGGAVPGPNDLQNYPVITAAACDPSLTVISGTLNSTASRAFSIDAYRNTSADSSGYGEGQVYVSGTTLTTDGSGNGSFAVVANGNFAGQIFSVTATDATTGDTSEFSLDVTATNGPVPLLFTGPYTYNGNGFNFTLALHTNQNYTIQTATNLAANPVVWTTLSNFTATNVLMQFTDRLATNSTVRQKFYRALTP